MLSLPCPQEESPEGDSERHGCAGAWLGWDRPRDPRDRRDPAGTAAPAATAPGSLSARSAAG